MIHHSIPKTILFLFFMAGYLTSFAQLPEPVIGLKSSLKASPVGCAEQTAGNVSFSNFIGQSDDIWDGTAFDTIFLCKDDQFDLSIAGQDLTGDANTSTAPGVGYAAYHCQPTVAGDNFQDVSEDACHYVENSSFMVVTGSVLSGNQTFINTGDIQFAFNSGNSLCVWYAPITYEALSGSTAVYENIPNSCVKVTIGDAFPVVFLNAVNAANIQNNVNQEACKGSFVVEGGLPEYDAQTHYIIDISLDTDPSVTAVLENTDYQNGEVVYFTAPQAGLYNITISDGKSCSFTDTLTLSECSIYDYAVQNSVCEDDSLGTIGVTLTGGSFPISVDYNNAGATPSGTITLTTSGQTETITTLTAGIYNLHFTDSYGMTKDTTIEISQGLHLGAGLPFQATTLCYGDTMEICPAVSIDGAVVTDLTGYSFAWSNGSTAQCQDTIPSGFFAVTITDSNGCTASASSNITQDSIISLNAVINQPTCDGVTNGSIALHPTGGSTENSDWKFTFQWEGSASTQGYDDLNDDLGPGTYQVSVSDDNGCVRVDSFTLTNQKIFTAIGSKQDISCYGADNGQIIATGNNTGGNQALPFTFAWSPVVTDISSPNTATEIGSNLAPGSYIISVTDADGCLDTTSVEIVEPDSMMISLDTIHHESCTYGDDGLISISVVGGSIPYSYAWNTIPVQTNPLAGGLVAGNYTIYVTDGEGCVKAKEFTINDTIHPVITGFTALDVICFGDSGGSLSPNIVLGNGSNITYFWGNGSSDSTITGLGTGIQCLSISDDYGCTASACDTIVASEGFYIKNDTFIKPTCVGFDDASIIVTMEGSGDFSYAWNNGGNAAINSGINAGAYSVTIGDNQSSCPDITATFVVPEPHAIVPVITKLNDASCFDGSQNDGSALATAGYSDGESANFSFTWQPNFFQCSNTTQCQADNLKLGPNVVCVDDGTCTTCDTIEILSPDSILLITDQTVLKDVDCYNDDNGAISIKAKGGIPGYSYGWAPTGQIGPNLTNVHAGNHTVVVTDAVGCSEVFNFLVDEPEELIVFVDSTKSPDVRCYGGSSGKIFLITQGGNGGETYTWTPDVSTSSVASDLTAGVYSVTVEDSKGCTFFVRDTVKENGPIIATLNPIVEPDCYGYQTAISIDTITGGAGAPYFFSVDYSPPQSILLDYQVFADSHIVIVYDHLDCDTTLKVDIAEPTEIIANLPDLIEVELGDSVRLMPIISSSLPLDTFFWTPNMFLTPDSVLNPLVVGLNQDLNYTLTVIDTNGCAQTASTLIEVDRNRNVYIPNIFSPNNDGYNDTFFPKASIGVKMVNSMRIFDRWGELIYEAKDFLPTENSPRAWNGTYRGKALNTGVYIYMIEVEFLDGIKLIYRGDVTLVK